ncbi:MAG TPA: oligosaccharide flippase family protein, partial [Anaerolineales bacterium]|nr:oligosaccharide flippase family protein [Anaerolineales bacterium]
MSKTKNYLSGLATGYTVTLVTVFVTLWLTPFTLRFLDREEYAIFTLAGDMLMWLGLLDLGISSGLNVQAAQLTGKPNQERLNRLASTAFFSQNFVSLSILLIGLGLSFLFPRFFDIRPELHPEAIQMMILMVIGVAVNMFVQTFSSLLIANQQIYMDNLIKLSLIVIRTVLTVVFLFLGWKMLSLAVANLVATLITSVLAIVRVRKLLPNLQIRRKWFSRDVLKETGTLGIWFSLGTLAGIVILNMDRI